MYGIYINLGCRFEFRTQKLPYEIISGNFFDSSILVIRSGYAKKDHFSILAVIQNIWDLHKYGLQIWIQNAKITLWKNFGQFFWFRRFWSSGPRMQHKVDSEYLAVFQHKQDLHIWTYINLGCRVEFRMQKLPYERISGNFSDFIYFGHHVRVCKKRPHFNISYISKCMRFHINLGCRFEFRTQKLPYEIISGNLSDFINFGHQVSFQY